MILYFHVVLLQSYEEQCGILLSHFVVNGRKAPLGPWLSFVMTAEPAVDSVTLCLSKVQIEAGFWLAAAIKMVPFVVLEVLLDLSTFRPLSEQTTEVNIFIIDANG